MTLRQAAKRVELANWIQETPRQARSWHLRINKSSHGHDINSQTDALDESLVMKTQSSSTVRIRRLFLRDFPPNAKCIIVFGSYRKFRPEK